MLKTILVCVVSPAFAQAFQIAPCPAKAGNTMHLYHPHAFVKDHEEKNMINEVKM